MVYAQYGVLISGSSWFFNLINWVYTVQLLNHAFLKSGLPATPYSCMRSSPAINWQPPATVFYAAMVSYKVLSSVSAKVQGFQLPGHHSIIAAIKQAQYKIVTHPAIAKCKSPRDQGSSEFMVILCFGYVSFLIRASTNSSLNIKAAKVNYIRTRKSVGQLNLSNSTNWIFRGGLQTVQFDEFETMLCWFTNKVHVNYSLIWRHSKSLSFSSLPERN